MVRRVSVAVVTRGRTIRVPVVPLETLNAKVADDLTGSAWAGGYTADFTDVDLTALTAEVRRRLGWSQRQSELSPGRYKTILPPSAVVDLMIYMVMAMEDRTAPEGRSAFSAPQGGTRLGERLTDLPRTLSTAPAAAGLRISPFLVTTASGNSLPTGQPAADLPGVRP
ncbi:MAG: hypothetical protein ACRDTC_19050 [Pseudonocardiaceae bacterium]